MQGDLAAFQLGGEFFEKNFQPSRKRAAQQFHLDLADMDARHHLTFDTFEIGKLSLDAYLDRIVFYQPRDFSRDDFKTFMFDQSQPFPDMLRLLANLKARHALNVAVVSNEARELIGREKFWLRSAKAARTTRKTVKV